MNKQTQSKVNTLVANYLKASDSLVIDLHSLGLDTPDLQRPYVIKAVCEALTKGKGWNESSTGKVMLDSSHERYQFLKTRVRDVMAALKGETRSASSGKADPVDAIIKAFNKLDAKQQKAVIKALA
jgi:ribosome-associated translation inhibitor RaiA